MRQNSHEKKQVYGILPGWHNLWLVLITRFDPQSVISEKCHQLSFLRQENLFSYYIGSHTHREWSQTYCGQPQTPWLTPWSSKYHPKAKLQNVHWSFGYWTNFWTDSISPDSVKQQMVGGRNEKAGGMTLLLLSSFVPPLDSTHLIILYNLLHGWGLEFLVLVFDGTTSLLLSPRFITTDRLVQCTLFGIVSILLAWWKCQLFNIISGWMYSYRCNIPMKKSQFRQTLKRTFFNKIEISQLFWASAIKSSG